MPVRTQIFSLFHARVMLISSIFTIACMFVVTGLKTITGDFKLSVIVFNKLVKTIFNHIFNCTWLQTKYFQPQVAYSDWQLFY